MPSEYHTEQTLVKVREALVHILGSDTSYPDECITEMQKKGILFREMKPTTGSRLDDLLWEFKDRLRELDDAQAELVTEFRIQIHNIEPVLTTIRMALTQEDVNNGE